MTRTRFGLSVRLSLLAAAVSSFVLASPASAHTGDSNCFGNLAEFGATYQGECEFPFQGYPIGMAGVYTPGETTRPGEIHVEVVAQPAFGTPRSLGMECYDPQPGPDGVIPKEYRTTRCYREYNSPETDQQFTLVEPIPMEIVALKCSAHSHAKYSRDAPPSGMFACWSTNEAREDLYADGVMERIGY